MSVLLICLMTIVTVINARPNGDNPQADVIPTEAAIILTEAAVGVDDNNHNNTQIKAPQPPKMDYSEQVLGANVLEIPEVQLENGDKINTSRIHVHLLKINETQVPVNGFNPISVDCQEKVGITVNGIKIDGFENIIGSKTIVYTLPDIETTKRGDCDCPLFRKCAEDHDENCAGGCLDPWCCFGCFKKK